MPFLQRDSTTVPIMSLCVFWCYIFLADLTAVGKEEQTAQQVHVVTHSTKKDVRLQVLADSLHASGGHVLHVFGLNNGGLLPDFFKNYPLPRHLNPEQWGPPERRLFMHYNGDNMAWSRRMHHRMALFYNHLESLRHKGTPDSTLILYVDAWDVLSRRPWTVHDLIRGMNLQAADSGGILFQADDCCHTFSELLAPYDDTQDAVCGTAKSAAVALTVNRSFYLPTFPISAIQGANVCRRSRDLHGGFVLAGAFVGNLKDVSEFMEVVLKISFMNQLILDQPVFILASLMRPDLVHVDLQHRVFSPSQTEDPEEVLRRCAPWVANQEAQSGPLIMHFYGDRRSLYATCVDSLGPGWKLPGGNRTHFFDIDSEHWTRVRGKLWPAG